MTLNNALKSLGMQRAFNGEMADFSGITEAKGVFIDEVRHKSRIEVNEEGTEAAAVTSVRLQWLSEAVHVSTPFRLVVDRPFLFAVRDRFTSLVLFLGVVTDPQPGG